MPVFTIAAGLPFAETLARGLIDRLGAGRDPLALADATIYLPTRRAVRTLGETFARVLGGAALLPRMRPLGDVEDDEFHAGDDDIALMPAIAPLRRRLLLATLVQRWDRARHGGSGQWPFAQATQFARALAAFLDEAETQEADLSALETLAPENLAGHWAEVREFLVLLRDEWPKLLAAEGALDPAAHRNRQLDALARHMATQPPAGPVIAAGTTGSVPATARLLATIASLPNGIVILPGLDRDLDGDSWDALDPGHPQYGLKELIGRIGIVRDHIPDWNGTAPRRAARVTLLRETLRPAPTTDAWRGIVERGSHIIADGLQGLARVEAAHPGEEALAIALILRETLETKRTTAALVTPDRMLARRVAAELARWNIAIDDSAGRPLAHTPPGNFLLLLADAIDEHCAPVPLLALLKHPFCAAGMDGAQFRRMARTLDRLCLRGPRPDPGLDGIRKAIAKAGGAARALPDVLDGIAAWFETVAQCLQPLIERHAEDAVPLAELIAAHAHAAELLAATGTQSGDGILWRGEAGIAAAELLAAMQSDSRDLPPVEPRAFAPLLRMLSEERAIRPVYGRHPRLAILGPLEARLQAYDVVVLGGLNEGSWPAPPAADPWLSRPMRAALGLASPERAIGLAAHDFAMLAAGPQVVLTRALKAEGSPTIASRWLQRLYQLTRGLGLEDRLDPELPYAHIAATLEQPGPYAPQPRPAPRPPVALRPRSLSVTEIERWLRDPYAIYAKHVLKLLPLEPIDAAIGPLERGTLIHRILELFVRETSAGLPPDAEARLLALAEHEFRNAAIPNAVLALWRPRFIRAAQWFVAIERRRRESIAESFLEVRGRLVFPAPGGDFVLRARADRIDVLRDGSAAIVDYKTGALPSASQLRELLSPQLPLEGAILAGGGFEGVGKRVASELCFIRFGGGAEPGEEYLVPDAETRMRDVERKLGERVAAFDDPRTPYWPRVMPLRSSDRGDYDHLARVLEWSLSGWEESPE